MKQRMFGDGRGGGVAKSSRYRLTRGQRALLLGLYGWNLAWAFFNWWQWFEKGSVLGLGCGFFGIVCVLWSFNKTRHLW
jgi:hypothetical protein